MYINWEKKLPFYILDYVLKNTNKKYIRRYKILIVTKRSGTTYLIYQLNNIKKSLVKIKNDINTRLNPPKYHNVARQKFVKKPKNTFLLVTMIIKFGVLKETKLKIFVDRLGCHDNK